jgi:hypothetical protein
MVVEFRNAKLLADRGDSQKLKCISPVIIAGFWNQMSFPLFILLPFKSSVFPFTRR